MLSKSIVAGVGLCLFICKETIIANMSSATIYRYAYKYQNRVRRLSVSTAYSNIVSPKNEEHLYFKTKEVKPINHSFDKCGLYYTVPETESHIFNNGGLPKPFMQQCSTFNEMCFLIRKPGVEIIQYLQSANYTNPLMKYILHGSPGVGKSLVLAHVLHHAFVSKWLIIHVPWVGNWLRSPKEVVNSLTRPGFVDLPENAVKWLLHFKTQNQAMIRDLDLKLNNDYEWSKRELSHVGDSLMDIIELGLNRSRHASEIIIALIKEIKEHCKQDKCKAIVAIDGLNGFFHSDTRIRNEEKNIMPPEKVSFIPAFLESLNSDWHNAAAVLTCDELVVPGHNASSLPLYQLGISGFHYVDPFVPIHVPLMNEDEIRNVLAYYKERKWLQLSGGDEEIIFLAGGNPYKLMNLCNAL